MPKFASILAITILVGCWRASPQSTIPVITRWQDRDRYLGQIVRVRGEVSSTKIEQIEGVDVSGENLRGQVAEATGFLTRWEVSDADVRAAEEKAGGPISGRGPGTFYRLSVPGNPGKSAKAVVVSPRIR